MKIELVTANEKAYEVLSDEILLGKRKSGDRLIIEKIAKELGISSTPVRDALRRLASEGIVTILPRSGTFVSLPSKKDINDLFHFRIAVEKYAISVALPNLTEDHVASMTETVQRARSVQKDQVFVEADREFHRTIIECADNVYLSQATDRIDRQLRFIRTICATDHSFDNKVLQDHDAILKALPSKDPKAVMKLMEEHIRFVLEETLRMWPAPESERDNRAGPTSV